MCVTTIVYLFIFYCCDPHSCNNKRQKGIGNSYTDLVNIETTLPSWMNDNENLIKGAALHITRHVEGQQQVDIGHSKAF